MSSSNLVNFPPKLWSLLYGTACPEDFSFFSHPAGFSGVVYKHGKWPKVKKKRTICPGVLEPSNIKVFLSMYYTLCPLCHCVNPHSSPDLKKHIECTGWNGTAPCPGYYTLFFRPGDTCSIQ